MSAGNGFSKFIKEIDLMSRIGKKPVEIPSGVTVKAESGKLLVQGSKGSLEFPLYEGISLEVKGNLATLHLTKGAARQSRALFGLTRSMLVNLVRGVSQGYQKRLEVVGVGWNANLQGKDLTIQVGYCSPLKFTVPAGISVKCPQPTQIVLEGIDKQKVGQFAAEIRTARPPEPYNGKGIKYFDEVIRRKAGKAFAGTGSA